MRPTLSTFVDVNYFPLVILLLNSLKYYQVDADLKFYDYLNLNHLFRSYLETFGQVISAPKEDVQLYSDVWTVNYFFKPYFLKHCLSEREVIIDTDTIALSDLNAVFEGTKDSLVVAPEFPAFPLNITEADFESSDRLIIEHTKVPIPRSAVIQNYNFGLVGFNKILHKPIIDELYALNCDIRLMRSEYFNTEQRIFSYLVAQHKPKRTELEPARYMNTWGMHANPKKLLLVENGKYVLRDSKGTKIDFYHFTGGIDVPLMNMADHRGLSRLFHYIKHYDDFNEAEFPASALGYAYSADVAERLWTDRYQNPILLLVDYLKKKELVKFPKILDFEFRATCARLLQLDDHLAPPVIALSLLYDYANLLGYVPTNIGQLREPYDVLKRFYPIFTHSTSKTISLDNRSADVSLSFDVGDGIFDTWASAKIKAGRPECFHGVYVSVNRK